MVFMYFCRPPGNIGKTVAVAQLVRASDCDSEGRGFEPHQLPPRGQSRKILFLSFFILAESHAHIVY